MKMFDENGGLDFLEKDPRSRYYLKPKRILRSTGNVRFAEDLLVDKSNQVTLEKNASVTVMSNGSRTNERASVLLDFGKEIHGSVRILIQYCKPRNVRALVRFGESVSEAITKTPDSGATNDHAMRDFEVTLSSMGYFDSPESGFRFVNVELLDDDATLALKSVLGVLIVRDIEYVGSFECNDKLLNNIFDTAAYTVHLNMQEYIWDGIKRDRLVWIGDMHPEIMTVCSVFGDNEVIRKSLDLSRDITPLGTWMIFSSYSMWWIMCHYDYYIQNGDAEYLEKQHEYMKGLVFELIKYIGEDGSENTPDKFLDWPTRASAEDTHAGIQGLFAMTMGAAEYLLEEMRDKDTACACREARKLIGKHVPKTARKQAAALLSLSGVGECVDIDDKVLSVGGGRGYSTFFSYYILAARAMAGKTADALDDLREYYGAMLKLGATSFWEDFNLDWVESCGGFEGVFAMAGHPDLCRFLCAMSSA